MYEIRTLSPEIVTPSMPPLHIAAIGRFRSRGRFRWEQVAKHAVLHCIRDGRGTFVDEGRPVDAGAGDVFLFQPGHHYQYFDENDAPWRYDFAVLAGAGDTAIAELLGSSDTLFRLGVGHVFWRHLDDAIDAYERKSLPLVHACRLTWELLEALARPDARPPGRTLGARVRDHLERLDTDFPTVNELAFHFAVDRATLFRSFREATGMSVKHWIDAQRFRRAQELLQVSDAPVREVARLCGFRDPLYFSRAFRQRVGIAPSAWRDSRRTSRLVERV